VASSSAPPEILPLIADPHRWRLLSELARSDRRVGELTELLGEPQNLVSYHLGQLRGAGIVSSRRSSADRRDVYYRADLPACREQLGAAGVALHPGLALAHEPPDPAVSGRLGRRRRVLFLCTGNSARSQMAEALLEHRSDHAIEARSAGSRPKPLHPNAVRVVRDLGIDISGNTTKPLTRFARSRFDRVVTLCDKVREICPEFPGEPIAAHWSIADPATEGGTDEETLPAFRRVAEEVEWRVDLLIADLTVRPTERKHHAS
jgi:protein-tyrosine-phosphatase